MMESKNPPFVTRLQLLMSELSSDQPPACSGWTLNIPEWEGAGSVEEFWSN